MYSIVLSKHSSSSKVSLGTIKKKKKKLTKTCYEDSFLGSSSCTTLKGDFDFMTYIIFRMRPLMLYEAGIRDHLSLAGDNMFTH